MNHITLILGIVCILMFSVKAATPTSCEKLKPRAVTSTLNALANELSVNVPDSGVIEVSCKTTLKPGVRGLATPDFNTGKIVISLNDSLIGESLAMTFHHELLHAVQYFHWMQQLDTNEDAQTLAKLASMMNPGKLNGSFQVRARLKRHPNFKEDPKRWLQVYTNVFFCMEYRAYEAEARYAETTKPKSQLVSDHVKALQAGNTTPLAIFLNKTVVKQYRDDEFTARQLSLSLEACLETLDPVEMFKASKEALNLSELNSN